jgi:hypothetical protein
MMVDDSSLEVLLLSHKGTVFGGTDKTSRPLAGKTQLAS